MRVVVSGGLGFIGSRVAESFARDGHSVVVLDNVHPQIHKDGSAQKRVREFAEVLVGDVRDPIAWDRVLTGADRVLHMAAETGTGQSMDEIARYADVNVRGTAVLADALGKHASVSRIFLPSSRAIYGEGLYRCEEHGAVLPARRTRHAMEQGAFELECPHCQEIARPQPSPEWTEPRPASVYASTKLSQEQILQLACEGRGIDLRVARYQNVYGPGQALGNPYTGVLVIFAQQIAKGQTLNIYEDGNIARDFVHIDEVVAATRLIVDAERNPGPVNVGMGRASTLIDVVHAFEHALSQIVPYRISGDFRFGDIRYAAADVSRLKALGFAPSTELAAGIAGVVEWMKGRI